MNNDYIDKDSFGNNNNIYLNDETELEQAILQEYAPFDRIEDLKKEDFEGNEIYDYLFAIKDENIRKTQERKMREKASAIKAGTVFNNKLLEYGRKEKAAKPFEIIEQKKAELLKQGKPAIDFDPKTLKPIRSIDNYLRVLKGDSFFKDYYFNEQADQIERNTSNGIEPYSDADIANNLLYIEQNYEGLCDLKLYPIAFSTFIQERHRNPLKEYIESIEWDGVDRISYILENFLHPTDDERLIREVSRLIFAGGIHRLCEPGCKFDFVPVLIGKQGTGKSTFIRWLNPFERYFNEIRTIEGKEGIENLQGGFVCEMVELLATKRAKDVEKVKSFITTQVDKYRLPYDKLSSSHPRRTIIIGSTNNEQFLTDATGNRRFLPIHVNVERLEFTSREKEFKEYVAQCWAEALAKKDTDFMSTYPSNEINEVLEIAQREVMEQDDMQPYIEEYLKDKEYTCSLQIQTEVFHIYKEDIAKGNKTNQQNRIVKILRSLPYMQSAGKKYFDIPDGTYTSKMENNQYIGSTPNTFKSQECVFVNNNYTKQKELENIIDNFNKEKEN